MRISPQESILMPLLFFKEKGLGDELGNTQRTHPSPIKSEPPSLTKKGRKNYNNLSTLLSLQCLYKPFFVFFIFHTTFDTTQSPVFGYLISLSYSGYFFQRYLTGGRLQIDSTCIQSKSV